MNAYSVSALLIIFLTEYNRNVRPVCLFVSAVYLTVDGYFLQVAL